MDIDRASRTAEVAERSFSEAARQLGIARSRLEDFEGEGLLSHTKREGQRARLEFIVNAEKLGLSWADIRAMIEASMRGDASSAALAAISDPARMTFGSEDKARRWVRRPTTALSNLSPLEVSSAGAKGIGLVLDLLKRIDHGLAV